MSPSSFTPSSLRRPARRRLSMRAGVIAALGIASMGTAGAIVASAAVPTFPDNLVVFPNRDFITVEGFQDHVGETALVEVTRNGRVIGSAQSEVAAGDVAFEINHPGGVCWGAGTDHKVTPDIQGGDKVSIRFNGDLAGDTTVQDVYVQGSAQLTGPTTVAISGHVGADVNRAQMEQRVVNPALTDTEIGRRDVRAAPGPVVTSDRGPYSSGIEFAGDTFTATYEFPTAAIAETVANGGGERIMAWQEEDADANRQGLTIAEAGEPGGPGMGGCPAGPSEQAAPQPGEASAVRSADERSIQVDWKQATPAPGAADVTGYSVVAIGPADPDTNHKSQLGKVTPASAERTTITGLDPAAAYQVEVRSITGLKMSEPYVVNLAAPPTDPQDPGDTSIPAAEATPAPTEGGVTEAGEVTLTTNEADADLFFTTDGSPVLTGDMPSDTAKLYTGPIKITEQTEINFVAIDTAGNFKLGTGVYAPEPVTVPAAPTLGSSIGGQGQVTARWNSTDTTITGYGVQLYEGTGDTTVGPLRETTEKSLVIRDLEPGTSYTFTVKAMNAAGYGPASERSAPLAVTAVTDRITISSARWKSGDFRVSGTGSAPGATLTVRRGSATGTSLGTGTVAADGTYSLRFRNGAAPATNPGTIYVTSNRGGQAGPFTVSNA